MCKLFFPGLLLFAQIGSAQSPIWRDYTTNKYGIFNPHTREPIVFPTYDMATDISQTDTLVILGSGRFCGVTSISGRTVIPLKFATVQTTNTGAEYGFFVVSKDGRQGLWNTHAGTEALPMEFEYTRAIYPDLLVGKRPGSLLLEFYDEKSQKRFETEGSTAWPGFDANTIEIISKSGERRFIDKTGNPIFSAPFLNARWTNGQYLVVRMPSTNGQAEKNALLTVAGDTLLPSNSWRINAHGEELFIVASTGDDKKSGIFNARTHAWLTPMGGCQIMTLGEMLFVQKYGYAEGDVYNAQGKQILSNCLFMRFLPESLKAQQGADYRPFQYVQFFYPQQSSKRGLFDAKGNSLLPFEFAQFWYFSEKHPVLASRQHPNRPGIKLMNAFDLKTGKPYFKEDFEGLIFTSNPNRFWAKNEGKWGIVSPGQKGRFLYEKVTPLPNQCFVAEKDYQWYFFDASGEQPIQRGFDWLQAPQREHYEEYLASGSAQGKMLAMGGDKTKSKGWYAITHLNSAVFIEPMDSKPTREKTIEEKSTEGKEFQEASELNTEEVMLMVEQKPEFPGGETAMLDFLKKHIQYPEQAKNASTEGKALIQFVVEKDGSITNIIILRDPCTGCGQEAIRLLKTMPRWKPGKDKGQPVRTRFTLPVTFKLE